VVESHFRHSPDIAPNLGIGHQETKVKLAKIQQHEEYGAEVAIGSTVGKLIRPEPSISFYL